LKKTLKITCFLNKIITNNAKNVVLSSKKLKLQFLAINNIYNPKVNKLMH